MKFFLITNNHDTAVGLRLAGIEGVVVDEPEQVGAELDKAIADTETGIILITEQLAKMCGERVTELKQTVSRPLIIEIPDRNSKGSVGENISRYVREAVGIKI